MTPTQINTWDAKTSVGHGHAISDVTGLGTALDEKQRKINSSYLDDTALASLGNLVNLNGEFSSLWIDCNQTGMSINNAGVKPVSESDEFLVLIKNIDVIAAPVTINFKYIDLDSGSYTPQNAGGITNVPAGEYMVLKGSFLVNDANEWVFVGTIKQTPA